MHAYQHNFNPPTHVPPTHALAQETLVAGVMKFTILVDPSVVLIIIYMFLIFLIHVPEWKRREEILHFHSMTNIAIPKYKNPCTGDC